MHIPTEILRLIVELLPIRDVKKVRLVSRRISLVASEYLISEVVISPQPKSIRRLLEIAKHPIFQRTVHTIRYEAEYYDPAIRTEDMYEREYISITKRLLREIDTNGGVLSDADYNPRFLHRYWNVLFEYRQAATDQFAYRSEPENELINLAVAFALLPNLAHISFGDVTEALAKINDIDRANFRMIRSPIGAEWSPVKREGFRTLMRALSSAGSHIKTLSIKGEDGKNDVIDDNIFAISKKSLNHCRTIARTLTSLSVYLDPCTREGPRSGRIKKQHNLRAMLKDAKLLQNLRISFQRGEDCDKTLAHFSDFCGKITFAHLRSFFLAGCTIADQELVSFSSRHSSTLRELSMTYIELGNSFSEDERSWVVAFNGMRDHLKLDKLDLGLLTGEDIDFDYDDDRVDRVATSAEIYILRSIEPLLQEIDDLALLEMHPEFIDRMNLRYWEKYETLWKSDDEDMDSETRDDEEGVDEEIQPPNGCSPQ